MNPHSLDLIPTQSIIAELVRRGKKAHENNYTFLIGKWNSAFIDGHDYLIKIYNPEETY
jgi:hypothetical protein